MKEETILGGAKRCLLFDRAQVLQKCQKVPIITKLVEMESAQPFVSRNPNRAREMTRNHGRFVLHINLKSKSVKLLGRIKFGRDLPLPIHPLPPADWIEVGSKQNGLNLERNASTFLGMTGVPPSN
ncbi:hypothetical protein T265_04288 [Opisthorchis viverrini]|uniref:Uncharacterized protein n=1 Tax=Opisthorchis viverrini TaxID=6198 RepID=A0A075AGR8_OPIVI|nr:hypothetical protein T265_04288 [Opisthorchis viverrini]KER28994.1 hypothetical protein T265_04288 [Opisthorchis viverrini]